VPATFEVGRAAKFRITVFAEPTASPTIAPVSEWPFVRELSGAWTSSLCGGSSNNATWHSNPRFGIRLLVAGEVSLRLSTVAAAHNFSSAPAVGMYILGDGDTTPTSEIVASCRAFSQHAVIRVSLPPATPKPFTILVATFRPGFVGEFLLAAFSHVPLDLFPM
jgi:hypothetical protein